MALVKEKPWSLAEEGDFREPINQILLAGGDAFLFLGNNSMQYGFLNLKTDQQSDRFFRFTGGHRFRVREFKGFKNC